MTKHDDVSGQHFDWLVDSRSQNQKSTLALYKIIETHEMLLSRNIVLQILAQDLASIAFSLWRAVFLGDLDGAREIQLMHVKKFLQSLIAHNAILYQTDFNTREWSFWYYLDNATARLRDIAELSDLDILPRDVIDREAKSAKDEWTNAQDALTIAIANFAKVIAANDSA